MDINILFKILQLDSIFGVLSWDERIRIHLIIKGEEILPTTNITNHYDWVLKWEWFPPVMRYGQDRLLYYENQPGQLRPIEELKQINLDLPCQKIN